MTGSRGNDDYDDDAGSVGVASLEEGIDYRLDGGAEDMTSSPVAEVAYNTAPCEMEQQAHYRCRLCCSSMVLSEEDSTIRPVVVLVAAGCQ